MSETILIKRLSPRQDTEGPYSGTIASGSTSVSVAHGLNPAPTLGQVVGLTLTNTSLVQKVYVNSVDASNVNFSTVADPGPNGQNFNFEIRK